VILPPTYTIEQLREWLKSELAGLIWRTEAQDPAYPQTLDNSISAAIWKYSEVFPRNWPVQIPAGSPTYSFADLDGFMGVWRVDFIQPHNIYGVTSNYMAQLLGVVVPNLAGMTGGGSGSGGTPSSEIELALQWTHGFQRVTSRLPQWYLEESTSTLHIHNPVSYPACAFTSLARSGVHEVRQIHRHMFAQLCKAKAMITLGNNRNKFSGQLPGPGGTTLTLNSGDLIKQGEELLKTVSEEMRNRRPRLIPRYD
jgi:hypothetical protein